MPRLIEQISTVIFGEPNKIGADAFVSTRDEETETQIRLKFKRNKSEEEVVVIKMMKILHLIVVLKKQMKK